MHKIFKLNMLQRIVVSLFFIIYCIDFLSNIVNSTICNPYKSDVDMIIYYLSGLGLLYCVVYFNNKVWIIKNNEIIGRTFLGKDRFIIISDIDKIKKVKIYFLSYVKIFLKNGKKINIEPLQNQDAFIQIVKDKIETLARDCE